MQCMGQYMGSSFAPRNYIAIAPDNTVAVRHRHQRLPEENFKILYSNAFSLEKLKHPFSAFARLKKQAQEILPAL